MDLNDEDFGYFTTTFEPKHTGIPATIHIMSGPAMRGANPFMLVARSEDKIYDYPDNIKIELQPSYDPVDDELLSKVHELITINYDLFVDHWYVRNGSFDLDKNLKPI